MPEQLTLEMIQNSPRLRELGAMPGDEFEGKKLIRKFSSKEDRTDLGKKITEEDISKSQRLQDLKVKPGDRYIDKKIIRNESDNYFKQMMYGASEGQGFVALGTDILTAQSPDYLPKWADNIMSGRYSLDFDNGFQYHSPEELYGKGFYEAPLEKRREMIERARERGIAEEYGYLFEPDPESMSRTVGQIGGMLADPTTLVTLGATLPKVMLGGAGFGSSYSVLEDLAQTGEVDPEKALMYGAFGAGGAGIGYGIIKGVGTQITKVKNNSAEKVVKNAEDKLRKLYDEGYSVNESFEILPTLVNNKELQKAIKQLGRPISVPPQRSNAAKVVKESITNDTSTAGTKEGIIGKALGVLSTRISEIDPAITGALRKYYYNVNKTTGTTLEKVQPFIENLRSLNVNPTTKLNISRNLYNGKFDEAERLMPGPMKENFNEVKNVLKNIYDDSQKAGIHFDELVNYFPRQIKDLQAFRKALGTDKRTTLTKLEQEYAKKLGLNSVNDLSLNQRGYVANQYARGYGLTTDSVPRFAKTRKIEELSDDFVEKFYEDPADALSLYIRNAINNIEKYKFFGKNAVKTKDGVFNIDDSIGKIMQQERVAGRLDVLDEDELISAIQSIFTNSERQMLKSIGGYRDLAYLGTIGNPYASITQLGDLGNSLALHGIKNTIVSAVRNIIPEKTPLIGKKQLGLVDVAINNISQELSDGNVRTTAKILNKVFDLVGFRRFDRLGKETTINAAFMKWKNKLKTAKGEQEFRKEFEEFYAFDPGLIDDIIADFKLGKFTENTKFHSFNELSDLQPVTMMEMPKIYIDNPNGRLAYTLKSFTIKQLDVQRRKGLGKLAKGLKNKDKTQIIDGTEKMVALAAFLSLANLGTRTIKDFLKGREFEPELLTDHALEELLAVYGFNKYASDRLEQDKSVTNLAATYFLPPFNLIEGGYRGYIELKKLSNEQLGTEFGDINFQAQESNFDKAYKEIPVVGPIYYQLFGGGAEKYNERQQQKVLEK
tara:strand:- start:105 stop:3110 length:3006 start_codon:yes stop_codon:yes gene_type:complete